MKYNLNDYRIEVDKLGKIIIYLRKSREDIIDGRYASTEETLARHEEQLQQWAEANLGYRIPENHIFKEVVSGEKIKNRPVFKEVLKMTETETIGGILCINVSRLSRGELKDCGTIIDTFSVTDTKILTPQKIYDLQNKYDKRFFKDEILRANDYLEMTKELLQNGRHWSTSIGKFVGSVAPFGYDRVTCKEMKVADEKGFTLRPNADAETVKQIFDMYTSGNGCYKIASHLNSTHTPYIDDKQWDRCIIQRILKNTTYCGFLTYGEITTVEKMIDGEKLTFRRKNNDCPIYKGLHTPVVSKEQFDIVQGKLKLGESPTRRGNETRNPLAGLVKCSVCNRAMVYNADSRESSKKRVHELDRNELLQFLNEHKKKAKLSARKLSEILNVKKHYCQDWFGGNVGRFHPNSPLFVSKWHEIKKAVNIETDKYDKAVTEFAPVTRETRLVCSGHSCAATSAVLSAVEKLVIEDVKKRFDDYTYFLDNYAVEITKKETAAKKAIKNIEKSIEQKEKQMKNAKIAFEKGIDSIEEYIDRKTELVAELEELKEKKRKAEEANEENDTETIKKSVPILKNVFNSYYELSTGERNTILRTIIESIEYTRIDGGEISLDICWLI